MHRTTRESKNLLLFFLLLVLGGSLLHSQRFTIENEKYFIEILQTNKADIFNASSSMSMKSKTFNTVHIQLRMATSNGEEALFDINKFSLVDKTNKLRIRPVDVAHRMVMQQLSFPRLATKSLAQSHPEIEEDISVPDSFHHYEFDGYEVLEIPLSFNTWGKTNSQVLYFRPGMYKKKKLDFYFPFLKSSSIGVLYYGEEQVAIVVFK